jgi:ubiquinone/menaquinone biosynthesis C-methylase UbiE
MEHSVRRAYDQVAEDYAARNGVMPEELIRFGMRFLARVGPAARILDLGCGAGRDLAWLVMRGARAVGVDLSAGMLAQARTTAPGPLAQMDMRGLAFPAGCFDGVWCVASFLHLPKADAPGALREMRRVLRPGGPLFLGIQEGSGEGWEGWAPGPYAHVQRLFARYSPQEVEGLLANAGFTVVERGSSQAGTRRWLQFLAVRDREP